MISEQTAVHSPTRTSGGYAPNVIRDGVESPGLESTGTRKQPRVVSMAIALLRALAGCGNPAFFEFERRGPAHRRLGPGVTRVSDSFWPLSDW